VVFGGVFLKELLPANNSLRRGFEQGVQDGSRAAVEAVARIHTVPEDFEDDFVEQEIPPQDRQ
jgi:hypothetical protein